jgi:hypothetical protein
MSEARFDRIENQIGELRAIVQQDITGMEQNISALERDVVALRERIDSVEGTLLVVLRDGFKAQSDYADDLANNEHKTRRLSRRGARLERAGED